MLPDFELGGMWIHSWGWLLSLALAAAMWAASSRLAWAGYPRALILHIGALSLVAGVLGARLWGLVQEGPDSDAMVSFGGYAGGVGAVLAFVWWKGLPVAKVSDLLAPSVMVGAAVGRLGCFFNGCCYGGPTTLPWGLRAPTELHDAAGDRILPVSLSQWFDGLALERPGVQQMLDAGYPALHPTQLYSALATFALFLVLDRIWLPRKRFDGEVALALGVGYGVLRFLLELPRVDTIPGPLGLVPGQLAGLILAALCLPPLIYFRLRAGAEKETLDA